MIIIIYFTKYRLVQLNYSQIGVSNYHLEFMVKNNLNKGFVSIIFIPRNSEFSFVKKIFKNLIIIDSVFLNFICLPFKTSSLISCKTEEVDHFLNSKLQFLKSAPVSKIYKDFKSYKFQNDIYKINKNYLKNMSTYLKKNFPKINLQKTFIFHHRESGYNKTSKQRGSKIKNYVSSIKFLLSKGYHVVRLKHSNSNKIKIKNKNYHEINIDFYKNKLLQYFLILKSRGLLCNSSGPGSIGSLLSKPVYHTNSVGVNVHATNKYSMYLIKKIKYKKKIIPYSLAIANGYFSGFFLSLRYCRGNGYDVVENSPQEILAGLKEFINIKKNYKISKYQRDFKKLLPNYMEMKLYDSNISNNYIIKNKKLFKNLIK